MARKIGIFNTEQQAIDAIQQLEQAGFVPGELRVLTKDSEHSRRIEAESDVHADELHELENASAGRGPGFFSTGALGYAGITAAPVAGTSSYGTSPLAAGIYPVSAFVFGRDDEHTGALQSLGLNDEEAGICRKALQRGDVVVIAQTDDSMSLLDQDGGPDLSRLAAVEAVFRNCNSDIASGA